MKATERGLPLAGHACQRPHPLRRLGIDHRKARRRAPRHRACRHHQRDGSEPASGARRSAACRGVSPSAMRESAVVSLCQTNCPGNPGAIPKTERRHASAEAASLRSTRPGSSPVGRLAGPGMPCPRCPRPCTTGHAPGAFPAAPTAQVRRALDGRSDRARPSGLRPVVAPTELRTRPCPPLTLTPHPEFPHRRTPRLGSQAGPRREVPPRVPRRRSPRVIGRPLAVHPLQTSTFGLRPYHLNLVVAVRRTRRVPADPGGTWSRRRAGQGPRVRCAGGALLNRACRATRACVVVDGRAVGVCPKRRGWSRKWRSTDSVRWNARSWLGSAWAGWRRFHRPESSATRLSPVPQRRGAGDGRPVNDARRAWTRTQVDERRAEHRLGRTGAGDHP